MFSLKFILLYFLAFFIYLNFKLSLLFKFIAYGKKLANSEKAKIDYKKRLEIKKRAQEISDIELRMWYEESVFKKVSGLEYSENIARTRYEVFLEKNEINVSEKPAKKSIPVKTIRSIKEENIKDDDPDDNTPLFTIKIKKK